MAVLGIVGAVLLTLLKVVLILLLLVLVIVLLVLFVPVRYGIWLEKEDGFSAQARVSWLCRLVSFRVLYEQGEPELSLRVFGFNLLAWLQRRRERAKKEADSAGEDAEEIDGGQGALVKMDWEERDSKEEDKEEEDSEEADISMAEVSLPEYPEHEEEPFTEDEEEIRQREGGFFHVAAQKLRRLRREILRRFRAMADFFKGLLKIVGKIRKRVEWLGDVRDFWRSENTRQMVCIFRDNVLHLWRKLKPRTVKGQVWFGTGEPCSTGQILGVCAMLFACYGEGIAITPDFERQIFEGKLVLKGRLSLITAVVIVVKVFFSRQWKTFRREWNVIGGSLNE